MKFLQKYADNTKKDSIVNKWRRKRFAVFYELIRDIPKPVKILDAGGTENFWVQMDVDSCEMDITLLNTESISTTLSNIKYIKGDARDLSRFGDNEFDVVFSNSVIEHVGGFDEQKKMADEITRTGKRFYVQTPNYYFPVEPHFLFPLFQFLPRRIQRFLVMNFRMGWFEKCSTKKHADEVIDSIHLLNKKQVRKLFPEGEIVKERLLGLTKSFLIISKK